MSEEKLLTTQVYSAASTLISDPDDELARGEGTKFGSQYPCGLYTTYEAFYPREVVKAWQVKGAQRLAIYSGLTQVWEGRITNLGKTLGEAEQGVKITARGFWADVLMQRKLRKPWADTRIGADIWQEATAAYTANDKSLLQIAEVDRQNRIHITPKAVAWTNGWYHRVTYTTPTGQTIKRITFNYDLQEAGQQWKLEVYDGTNTTALWNIAASGTGSQDITLGTPSSSIFILFASMANQTPAEDGTIYGELTNIVVYTETGDIHSDEIVKDVAAIDSRISTDLSLISANTLDLVPFVTDDLGGYATLADILAEVMKYGDASYNNWAVGVKGSDWASDGLPVIYFEQVPALTDYDYAVSIDEQNLAAGLEISQDFDELYNWIIVEYQNIQGQTVYVTPDDDANLKDTTSITDWGQRDTIIQVKTTSLTTATSVGRTYLAAHKDPTWRVNGAIKLVHHVRVKSGGQVAACEVVAGKRIKIENYLDDLSGSGLTFLIATAEYEEATDTVTLGIGNVDSLAVWMASLERR